MSRHPRKFVLAGCVTRYGSIVAASVTIAFIAGPVRGQCESDEQFKVLASDAASGDQFGIDIDISGDRLVVGANRDDDGGSSSGSAYVYRFNGVAWVEEAKLTASDAAAFDNFGAAVAISGDAIVIGANGNDDAGSASGSAYVFRRDTSGWAEEAKLVAADANAFDNFGFSVDIDGDTIIIGAQLDDQAGVDSGAAYIFHYAKGAWTQQAKLMANDAEWHDHFGASVAIHQDSAIIGAADADDSGTSAGAAYAFRRVVPFDFWTQEAKLLASDGSSGDAFGSTVSVHGNTALIGTQQSDAAGGAYVFRFSTDPYGWTEEALLSPPPAGAGGAGANVDGYTAAIAENVAVVGVMEATGPGFATVFVYDGFDWIEQALLESSDAANNDEFAASIALDDDGSLAVGAWGNDDGGSASGSAYVFHGVQDCDATGGLDLCEILAGKSIDANSNGVPDHCEPMCDADLDGDGMVGANDLFIVLAAWGPCPNGKPCLGDLDGDNTVGFNDFVLILAWWGPCE